MKVSDHAERQAVERAISDETRRALKTGSRQGIFAGIVISIFLIVAGFAGILKATEVPIALSVSATAFMAYIERASTWNLLTPQRLRVAMALFVSFPTLGFLAAELVLPHGMATYLPGVFQITYIYFVAITGLLLDVRLSQFCGWFAGLQLVAVAFYSQPMLKSLIHIDDPVLEQDIVAMGLWSVKAGLVVATGYFAGGLGHLVRRLTLRTLAEQRDKQQISRLFGQYVSPEVRERLIAQRAGSHGERLNVVVLFCDLRGFTTFSEQADPQQLVDELNAYFDAMVTAISQHGGTVDKFIGDAVMAVFGGLIPLAQPAVAALDAAVAMRAALVELNKRRAAAHLPIWAHGIGLHFGPVLQGPIGSTERKEFTVIGDTVNTSARLEAMTKELGQDVTISQAFYAQLPTDLQARCQLHGEVMLKGRAAPVQVYGLAAN